ncbi:MAG TPA: hypothetical protein VGD60_01785 [Candidatus Acidoferrales bacterium]
MPRQKSVGRPLRLLGQIRTQLREVDGICMHWDNGVEPGDEERVEGLLERSFEGTLVLMESIGQSATRKRVYALFQRAKKNFTFTKYSETAGEPYSVWSNHLSNILGAVETLHTSLRTELEEPIGVIASLVKKFAHVEGALRQRHDSRRTLLVKDEYDIQDLLRSLLFLHFQDISDEDPASKLAGSSSRVDILLRRERIAIEIKKTHRRACDASLGRDLKLDIVDYRARKDCDSLVIVIDERLKHLANPAGLASDLRRTGHNFPVEIFFIHS